MIRYTYICQRVLDLYRLLPKLQFPISIADTISVLPNCRIMSYQEFAELNHCDLEQVILLCESKSGCTHYDIFQNRYLILYNASTAENNNAGRQLWTCGHEIGHIQCEHMAQSVYTKLAENGFQRISDVQFEAEADYFAATYLCPFPICRELNIASPSDIQKHFGLSTEASEIRFQKYMEWRQSHRKTAWENDIRNLFRRSIQ